MSDELDDTLDANGPILGTKAICGYEQSHLPGEGVRQ